jgi:hypothetical protein
MIFLPLPVRQMVLPHFKPLLVGILSIMGLLSGVVPTLHSPLSGSSLLSFSHAALAQSISDEDVENYARSLLAIEPIRQSAFAEIQRILGNSEVPAIACHRPNSLNNLNADIRQVAISYCNRAIQIVERNNLTISRFNAITTRLQNDPNLMPRIQEELIRLQRSN